MEAADWHSIDPALQLEAPMLRDLLQLWRRKCGERKMPARRDFSPLDLRAHLGWIVLVDVETAPFRLRYRLVGTEIVQRVGRDATGRYLDELYHPEVYDTAVSAYRRVVAQKCPLRVHGRMRHAEKGHIAFESLDLPLSADGETVSMIMTRGTFG